MEDSNKKQSIKLKSTEPNDEITTDDEKGPSNEIVEIGKNSLSCNEEINNGNELEIIKKMNDKNHRIIPKKIQLYKYVGRTLFLFLDKYENPIIIIGPHWPLYIFLFGLYTGLMVFIYIKYWKIIGIVLRIIGEILYPIFAISYTYTSFINPGYPKNSFGRAFGIPRNDYYFCELCRFWIRKSSYASHCFDCNICIEQQDHHCPWTGHCIGKNNLSTFYIFGASAFAFPVYLSISFYFGFSRKK